MKISPFQPEKTTAEAVEAMNSLLKRTGKILFSFAGVTMRLFFIFPPRAIPDPVFLKLAHKNAVAYAELPQDFWQAKLAMEEGTIDLGRLPEKLRLSVMEVLLEEIEKAVETSTGYPLLIQPFVSPPLVRERIRLGFEIVRQSDNRRFAGVLYLTTEALPAVVELVRDIDSKMPPKWPSLPFPARVEIGRSRITQRDFSDLEAQDIVLIDESTASSPLEGYLCFSAAMRFLVKISGNRIIVQ